MLDENLPTYRFRPSSENPLHTLLYYTHKGSEPSADYLIKRPAPSSAPNQYALGLFDIQYASVLYAEVLLRPEWTHPTLSAVEVRANGGNPVSLPLTPAVFPVDLYNPDQTVPVRYQQGSWSKDAWEFEVPDRSFRMPTRSKIDQEQDPEHAVPELVRKTNFRWKRDGRMSRDMTCFMSGKTVGGQKNKEPDITVALFKAGKSGGSVAIYEPNMARVEIEDRKGLEVVLLLSAEVIRDLYLCPKQDPFNTAGAPPPKLSNPAAAPAAKSARPPPQATSSSPSVTVMSGANGAASKSSQPPHHQQQQQQQQQQSLDRKSPPGGDAEAVRRQALEQQKQEREKKLQREQEEIKRMLEREEREEAERRRRQQQEREAQVNQETEALRKKYGKQPSLPPRPNNNGGGSGGAGRGASNSGGRGWFSSGAREAAAPPARPRSAEPSQPPAAPDGTTTNEGVRFSQPAHAGGGGGGGARKKFGNLLGSNSPYAGPAAGSMSGFFGGGPKTEEEKRRKMHKKRSTHF